MLQLDMASDAFENEKIDWSQIPKEDVLVIVEQLCTEIAEGASLTRLCKQDHYPPYATICRWRRLHTEVVELLEQAALDRGEYFHDQAVYAAKNADDGSWSAAAMQARVFQWAAAVANPDKFSEKKRVQNEHLLPATYIIHTGIVRSEEQLAKMATHSSESQPNLNESNLEGSIPSTCEYRNNTDT